MKLTGQCKKYFRRWLYGKEDYEDYYYSEFIDLPEAMQYGVLVDFFDSVGIIIEVTYDNLPMEFDCYVNNEKWTGFFTRQEARAKVLEKANEIYNAN